MTIRALLMDADGVVQYPRSGWLERFARLGGPGFTREAFRREMSTLTGQVDLRDELAEIIADGGHDATPEDFMEHLAVTENGDAPATTTNWHEHVADEGYYRP